MIFLPGSLWSPWRIDSISPIGAWSLFGSLPVPSIEHMRGLQLTVIFLSGSLWSPWRIDSLSLIEARSLLGSLPSPIIEDMRGPNLSRHCRWRSVGLIGSRSLSGSLRRHWRSILLIGDRVHHWL